MNILRQAILRDVQGFKEFIHENFARVNRRHFFVFICPLVVVHDLDFMRVTVSPFETYPPLSVDPDAVSSLAVVLQLLQIIAGRRLEVAPIVSGAQHHEFAQRNSLNIVR